MSKCIGCGCTDNSACNDGCWWEQEDPDLQIGICSNCNTPENNKKYSQAKNEKAFIGLKSFNKAFSNFRKSVIKK